MSFILVTGSQGLIGSALTKNLSKQGVALKFLDTRLPSSHPGFGTILDKIALKNSVRGCIGIVHLAGTSRVLFGEKNPKLCLSSNVEGTNNVIEAALESPYKPWIIYASSREVYGQQEILPVCEDACLNPMNIYARSKLVAENKILEANQAGLSTAILRFSNVFGNSFDHHDRVIPAFCRAALRGESLRVEGGENVFDFTFVEDVVRGITNVINILLQRPQALPPIHFTTGRPLTLKEAAHIIIKKAKSSSNLEEATPRSFDVSRFYGNPSRAKNLLNWSAQFSFEEVIEQYLPLLTLIYKTNKALSEQHHEDFEGYSWISSYL